MKFYTSQLWGEQNNLISVTQMSRFIKIEPQVIPSYIILCNLHRNSVQVPPPAVSRASNPGPSVVRLGCNASALTKHLTFYTAMQESRIKTVQSITSLYNVKRTHILSG